MAFHRVYKLLTWLMLFLGLTASGMAGYWMKKDTDAREYQQFLSYCEEVKLKIAARLKTHEHILLSSAAMFESSDEVTRKDWQMYAKRLRINEHFNGIQGLCFVLWVKRDELSAHEASIQKQGFPNYHVHPKGQRDFYAPVIYLSLIHI